MARSPVPNEERVFSLVLALVSSEHGLTKHELLSSVYGYADRYGNQSQRSALDRQFERDKEQLRGLGIPVETIDAPGEPGNNQLSRYRISKSALDVPPGLEFTDRELMMLRMAALAWREGSLTDEARRAAMKLESLSRGAGVTRLGVNAGFGATDPAAPALLRAIQESTSESPSTVEFEYQLADRDAPLLRHVVPLQLHRFEGRWHLISYDLERESTRIFLLSRITGAVTLKSDLATPALPESSERLVARAISELQQLQREQRVSITVRSGSIAAATLTSRADVWHDAEGTRTCEFGTVDMRELAQEIAGFGADTLRIEPAELRERVVERLTRMAAMHAGTDGSAA